MNAHSPASCATCANADCRLSFVSRDISPVAERTAFVLDEMWPELRDHVARMVKADDQVLFPGLMGRTLPRYAWGQGRTAAGFETVHRHLVMRKVARAAGAVRQPAYLEADRKLATALAKRIDYRARHVVVSQTLLPFLWREGVLGGRSFDVLMTRYPLAELQARLDAVAARWPQSPTIADFRAPEALVADEAEALSTARRLVSPHHHIAEMFADRAVWLDWQRPAVRARRAGDRVAFLGPSIARQGAYAVREMVAGLKTPLIVFGADLEGAGFWRGIDVERRAFDTAWLDDIGAILHPAAVTHAPRRLVEAVAHGVTIYAEPTCGLAPGQFRPLSAFMV